MRSNNTHYLYQDHNLYLVPQDVSKESYRVSTEYFIKLGGEGSITHFKVSGFESRTIYQGGVSPLKNLLNYVNELTDTQVEHLLLKFTDENVLRIIKGVKEADLRELIALLLWINEDEAFSIYGEPLVDAVIDEETNEFQFISIILPNCGADSWDEVVRGIKDEMKRAGLNELISKVAIVCLKGLQ